MSSSVPYDPFVGSAQQHPQAQQTTGGPSKTQAIRSEIDGTVDLMRDNIQQLAVRGGQLDSLQDKTDNLAVAAHDFQRGASRVRKRMWWKDMKMRMCLIIGVIILIIVIVVPIAVVFKH